MVLKLARAFLVVSVVALGLPRVARAHDLGATCTLQRDAVQVVAYFEDDTPAAEAKVEVFDRQDRLLTSGLTDAKGTWTFPTPPPGKYRVSVKHTGHLVKTNLSIPGQAPVDPTAVISDGPARHEFTAPRWWKLGIGLGLLTLFVAAFLVARRKS